MSSVPSLDPVAGVHLVATLMMSGLIVFVQVVHYPLGSRVGADAFPAWQAEHTVRTGWVVVPLMLAEAATALWLLAEPPGPGVRPVAMAGVGLLALIWLSTVLVQAPAHGRLVHGFDGAVHRRLVRSNWIRTAAWLLRIPVALLLALPPAS